MRNAVGALPPDKAVDAATVWEALRLAPFPRPLSPMPGQGEKSVPNLSPPPDLGEVGWGRSLPRSWTHWLENSSLPAAARDDFLRDLATRPPLYLRVNHNERLEEIKTDLAAHGFTCSVLTRDSGLVTLSVTGTRPIYELPAHKKGYVEIQDLASQLIGEAVDAHPGMSVWDVCAGGGGKTMQIASQMQNRGVLYASDIRDYKLDELKLRARRAGFHNVRRFVYDAEKAPELTREIRNTGGFHRVLVDAPCSASGTLRRNPDVRYRVMPGDPEKFAELQLKILNAVHPQVRAQGKLIYATCSVFRTENEEVVEKFLRLNPFFELEKSELVGSPVLNADTMFFAVMRRK